MEHLHCSKTAEREKIKVVNANVSVDAGIVFTKNK